MKKFGIFMCSLALVGMMFTSCDQKGQGNGDVNLDEVIEDGFYVAGAATGSEKLVVDYMMAVGLNEVDGKKRDGM